MKNENEDGDFSKLVMELATGLAEAVMKDEVPEEGGFDLSAGMFGRHVSGWLRSVANELESQREGRLVRHLQGFSAAQDSDY